MIQEMCDLVLYRCNDFVDWIFFSSLVIIGALILGLIAVSLKELYVKYFHYRYEERSFTGKAVVKDKIHKLAHTTYISTYNASTKTTTQTPIYHPAQHMVYFETDKFISSCDWEDMFNQLKVGDEIQIVGTSIYRYHKDHPHKELFYKFNIDTYKKA